MKLAIVFTAGMLIPCLIVWLVVLHWSKVTSAVRPIDDLTTDLAKFANRLQGEKPND